jgi:hypothetical protein
MADTTPDLHCAMSTPKQVHTGISRDLELRSQLIAIIDADLALRDAGIVLVAIDGTGTEIRGGPRRHVVFIVPDNLTGQTFEEETGQIQPSVGAFGEFWERWGGPILSCGSAAATGAVIGLSGGTAAPAVGVFAVNSALLCGTSLGRAIADDAWKEFARHGGATYVAWMSTETILNLVDLCNGVKGAAGLVKNWKQTGKLELLRKAIGSRKLTRAQLYELIKQVDPSFVVNINRKKNRVTKMMLVATGRRLLDDAGFAGLANARARVVIDAVGNALTLYGGPGSIVAVKSTWQLWVVQHE